MCSSVRELTRQQAFVPLRWLGGMGEPPSPKRSLHGLAAAVPMYNLIKGVNVVTS
jgi:hypothetical protein